MKEKSGIQLKAINIDKSIFVRGNLPTEQKDYNLNISISNTVENNKISVSVGAILSISDFPQFSMDVLMTGFFEQESESEISLDNFRNINAPAIIFPYIRQHVRNMSMDAGINPIILPVINFVARYNIMKEKRNLQS